MRIRVLRSMILFFFFLLVVGLFYTQIWRYSSYKERAEKNRIRIVPLEAPRGKIYDRNSKLLVTSRISFDVEVVYKEIKDKEKIIESLVQILGLDHETLSEKIDDAKQMPFLPVRIAEDVEKEKAISVEEISPENPGLIVTTRPMRDYLYNDVLSHAIGYLGKINPGELERYRTYGYRMQDLVGKDGIEKEYNDYLRGADGGIQAEVDSRGRRVKILAMKEPSPGKDLYLTIDINLQEFCDSLLADKRGVIIAISPETGEVLALASHPAFDPNIFVESDKSKEITEILKDSTAYPLLDRVISCAYPPGSVFKIVVATSALDLGLFDKNKTLFCGGSLAVGNRVFRCWRERGHGTMSIFLGLENSCNVFFYQLGLLCGPDNIADYAFKFGLGRLTGIDLPGEVTGFVPTVSWKKKNLRKPWFKGETANYSIGQGYLLVTPVQVARLVSAVANEGMLVNPFVVRRIANVDLRRTKPINIGIKKEPLDIVKHGLRQVVNGPHGTGFYAKSREIVISGKTGTAQNPAGESHAWFAGFAPFEKPKIAVVVFIEHGGKGGLDPARFGKQIIEKAKAMGLL